ncbi:MAG: zinc ribbon domain-containing protein [Chloroflexota bacterium]|jgi:predicted  nucleic acid-binding Zn-ribbon protein
MSAALGLFRLQQVDRQLDQAQARLSVIRQTLENDVELRAALDQVAQAGEVQKQAEQNLREAEDGVQAQQIKIEQAESSLYGGRVHNPKELQDLQQDIASLKRFLTTLEERQLDAMLEVETAQDSLQAAETALSGLQSRRGSQHTQLLEERSTLARTLERLGAERQAVVGSVGAPALEVYERLRQQRRGIAVAEISENACSACGATLTAALQQSARSTLQVSHCPTCSRILYAA